MDELLIKYVLGEASPEETALIERWLAADAANRVRLEQFRTIRRIGRRLAEAKGETVDPEDAWLRFRQRIGRAGKEPGPAPASPGVRRMRPVRWVPVFAAACLTGVLVLGIYLVTMKKSGVREGVEKARTAKAPAGAVNNGQTARWVAAQKPATAELPDRSVVTLNRGSSLAMSKKDTGGVIHLQLQGEAFFSVVHDPARRVIVEVNDLTIQVLGTAFELDGSRGDSVEVTVESGAVRVSGGRRMKMGVVVRAGEQLRVPGDGPWRLARSKERLYGYYLGRPMSCDSVLLGTVVAAVNKAYGAHIVLGRPELANLPLTATFRSAGPDKIAQVIAETFGLSLIRRDSTIILQ